ncbi:MBOAT family O-acyltransferase [Leadbettera azotonutricia]|nr:MBOAT family protein [Leadbettera azotonutricia]
MSLFFYAWGEPLYVLLMIFSIMVNWAFGLVVDKVKDNKKQVRITVITTCVVNLAILFVFKYLGFVVSNINMVAGRNLINFTSMALPLGISFYTFQSMSYVIDISRNDAKVEKNPFYVGLYVAFFPQLVAGPIVRYTDVADQILNRRFNGAIFFEGCCQFISGMGKKVLISNAMAMIADNIFNLSAMGHHVYNVPVTLAWLGLVAYTLQIFFDFSGYSEMAIGLGRMFGFEFLMNFNYPYIAKSIVDFWRRWHISLSTWFKEYVYIPLGGSRMANNDLMVRNTFVVWLLTGVWHGADWTYILWGLWHFVFIIFERLIKWDNLKIPNFLRHVYTLLVVMIGWLFFRAIDFYQFAQYFLNLVGMNNNGFYSDTAFMLLREYWVFFLFAIISSTPVIKNFGRLMRLEVMGVWNYLYTFFMPIGYITVFIISITFLAKGNYNPFIYFNF